MEKQVPISRTSVLHSLMSVMVHVWVHQLGLGEFKANLIDIASSRLD